MKLTRKRATITTFFTLALIFASATQCQQSAGVRRIGFLGPQSTLLGIFRDALADRGHVDGRNIIIEAQWPDGGELDRLPATAATLAASKPDVIVAIGATATRAALRATNEIPIVFEVVVDPVANGLIVNAQRPGGNATGFTSFDPQQARRQIEILKQAISGLARVALLSDAGAVPDLVQTNEDAVRELGLSVNTFKVERSANPDFSRALEAAKKDGAGAVVIISTPVTAAHRKDIVEHANRLLIPTLSPRDHEDAAPLIAYGNTFAESTRRSAGYVARILEGAKPGDLPVETVRQPELILNLATARTLALTVPRELLERATRVND